MTGILERLNSETMWKRCTVCGSDWVSSCQGCADKLGITLQELDENRGQIMAAMSDCKFMAMYDCLKDLGIIEEKQ